MNWWRRTGRSLKGKLLLNLAFHRKVWIPLYDVLQCQNIDARWVPCVLVRNESFRSLNLPAILISDSADVQFSQTLMMCNCTSWGISSLHWMQWNTGSSLWPRNETLVYEYSQNASPEENKIQNSGIGKKTHGSDDNHFDFFELCATIN